MNSPNFVQLAFPIPVDNVFDYRIPPSLRKEVKVGQRIRAPFGRLHKVGYAVKLLEKSSANGVKEIESLLENTPLLTEPLFELGKLLSRHYLCSLGESLEAILPISLRARQRLARPGPETLFEAPKLRPINVLLPHLKAVEQALGEKKERSFLFWEGKEGEKISFYKEALRLCLGKAHSSILLFPEIQQAEEVYRILKEPFGETVALWHGELSPLIRHETWLGIQEGRVRALIGTRSAIFAPFTDLGLIVVDSEEDPSYKQDETPRYHARQIALFRRDLEKTVLLFHSQNPSLESLKAAKEGRLELLKGDLTRRGGSVRLIDLRGEKSGRKRRVLFSKPLELKLQRLIESGKTALLFLNRRGFATFIHCKKCKTVFRCPDCQVSFRYHFRKKKLTCPYCNREESPPEICPQCKESYVSYSGSGTEKVESELQRLFPMARIGRLDLDNASKRPDREKILESLRKGEVNFLVGTQLLASGGFFPEVDLVAVLSAEALLNRADFRASERALSLFSRLFHRLKEGSAFQELCIQTFTPEHPVFKALATQDYDSFYKEEMASRKELRFPPFYQLAQVVLASKKDDKAKEASLALQKSLKRKKGVWTAGPAPCDVRRKRGFYQWQLLVKSKGELSEVLAAALKKCALPSSIRVTVDVDPQ